MKNGFNIQSVYYINATDLVPRSWLGWFWTSFSENCPFSFGDNNYTLVDGESFFKHAEQVVSSNEEFEKITPKQKKTFFDELNKIANSTVFVNIEG
jgi:hypothetical protein